MPKTPKLPNRKQKQDFPIKPYLVVWLFLCPILYIVALLLNFLAIRTFYIAIGFAGIIMLVFAIIGSTTTTFHPDNQRGLFNMITPKELGVLLIPVIFVILVDAIASMLTGQFF